MTEREGPRGAVDARDGLLFTSSIPGLAPRVAGAIPGPRSQELARSLRRSESPNITFVGGAFPIFWKRASGCRVEDVDGNVYLDFTSAFGVAGVGHTHPDVVAAIQAQSAELIHGMGDVHPSEIKVRLLDRIAARVPIPDAQIILGQNGSDAVEAAIKTARLATGKRRILAFHGGYHGLSYGALEATSRQDFREPFHDQLGAFASHLPYGCPMAEIAEVLGSGNIGAVLVEPIQGRGGIQVPPPGWLSLLAQTCREHGALLILDEIFTGWGRTGRWFACEYDGIVPDILCIGKAMGGGMPISACITSQGIMSAWGESRGEALHTSTFLGNPLSCAAALAAIGVLERDRLPDRAAAMGAILSTELERLVQEFRAHLHSVRGRGLMIGLQFHQASTALEIVDMALTQGVILLPAGDGSVIEFIPPLIVTNEEVSSVMTILSHCLKSIS